MSRNAADAWAYLSQTPLLWLALTLAVYQAAQTLYRRTNSNPLCHPVFTGVAVIVGVLLLTGTPYERYFANVQFIHFLLGTATVALAIPLFSAYDTLRRQLGPLLGALLVGSFASALVATLLGQAFGLHAQLLRSMLPKSVTTPIAMGIAEQIGGLPTLTAALVLITGVLGAAVGPRVLDLLGIEDDVVRGFAMGIASHGIGTARALQLSETAGAFSGLAMSLNGALATVVVPLVAWLLVR